MRATSSFVAIAVAVASASFLGGCADSGTEPTNPATPVRASFADIQARVFTPSCATAGCHAGSAPAAGLNLSAGASYAAIVNKTSTLYPGQMRVLPGNAGESLMIKLLRRQMTPAMPPSGPIPSSVIDSIAAWVDAGALQN